MNTEMVSVRLQNVEGRVSLQRTQRWSTGAQGVGSGADVLVIEGEKSS